MVFSKKLIGLSAATMFVAMHAVPTLANVQVWNFNDASQNFSGSGNGNSLSLTSSDGVNLTVTGWSDTDDIGGDDEIETARLYWAQSTALGIINRDEDTGSPNHSIDSIRTPNDPDGEFDMLLLDFDTAVNLTDLNLDWAIGGNQNNTADVSVLAWDGTGSSALLGKTWSSILDSNGGDYASAGNRSNVGLNYFSVNPDNIESTKWLVGVYNPVFGSGGDAGDDGIKLSKIKTSTSDGPTPVPPAPVPVPGTVALILAGLLGLRARRQVKLKAS